MSKKGQEKQVDKLLKTVEVARRLGCSRATLWAMIAAGRFPAGARISPRRRVWRESDVIAWMDSLFARGEAKK